MIIPQGWWEELIIRYCNMQNGNKGIDYFLYIDHTASTVVLCGGVIPPCEKSMGGSFKNQCYFQYDTTKSLSISEVSHNNKIIILNSKLLFYSHFAF